MCTLFSNALAEKRYDSRPTGKQRCALALPKKPPRPRISRPSLRPARQAYPVQSVTHDQPSWPPTRHCPEYLPSLGEARRPHLQAFKLMHSLMFLDAPSHSSSTAGGGIHHFLTIDGQGDARRWSTTTSGPEEVALGFFTFKLIDFLRHLPWPYPTRRYLPTLENVYPHPETRVPDSR